MDIDSLTLGQAKQLAALLQTQQAPASVTEPWQIGKIYLIRTVTMIDLGRLVAVTPQELVLEDAAWIADTGRFADALKSAKYSEVEPFPDGRVIIGKPDALVPGLIKTSDEVCAYIGEQFGPVTMLAFSRGKDSIAAWLKMREHFDEIVPLWFYLIPGLEFEDESRTRQGFERPTARCDVSVLTSRACTAPRWACTARSATGANGTS